METPEFKRFYRRAKMMIIVTAGLYALTGLGLCYEAYAQSRAPFTVTTDPIQRVPTGNDDATVIAYYDYLYLRKLAYFEETHYVNPLLLSWTYTVIGLGIISLYVLTYSWYSKRLRGDLHPVEVYNGYIAERGGPIDIFNWGVWSILVSYMIYYTVINMVFGQFY